MTKYINNKNEEKKRQKKRQMQKRLFLRIWKKTPNAKTPFFEIGEKNAFDKNAFFLKMQKKRQS